MRIILNADDFGKSTERNRAVDDCFKQGLISSAGLIVTGKHLPEAVDYIKKGGYAEKVHLHVNISANLLHEGSEDAPLTDSMRRDPFFCEAGRFKPYHGLPHKFRDIVKWRIVYEEIKAQYQKFIEITEGKGDISHIDFHLWYNLTWPVSVALNLFTWKYKIKSVRYIGLHQKKIKRFVLFRGLSLNPFVRSIPATNIDYFLSKRLYLRYSNLIELYCHPNYKDGVFLDDSPSYLKHERQTMFSQIQSLKQAVVFEVVSWNKAL